MNTKDLSELLAEIVEQQPGCERVQSFEDAGVMSAADGLVVHTSGGDEFRITVAQVLYSPAKLALWPGRHQS